MFLIPKVYSIFDVILDGFAEGKQVTFRIFGWLSQTENIFLSAIFPYNFKFYYNIFYTSHVPDSDISYFVLKSVIIWYFLSRYYIKLKLQFEAVTI